ncbi:hypothetical protein B0J18DRAFT_303678 [Chaetomium sp. MPI-SDFR-AT-0129]|nr:hypothetical protein B0J18DRAFT_303678 [Chaetomium sp. MPI-SDFR-AT-0129]
MQGDATSNGLRQSIAAFVITLAYCLIRSIFTRKNILVLRPRPDWCILSSWFALGVVGSALAVLAARTGDVRFHLGLKVVALLFVEIPLVRQALFHV